MNPNGKSRIDPSEKRRPQTNQEGIRIGRFLRGLIKATAVAFVACQVQVVLGAEPPDASPSRQDLGATVHPPVHRLPKLRIRASNPHLIEDENGTPFFVAGVCPQNMIHWCTRDKMDVYFADRQTRHFNTAWVVINGFDMATKVPATNPVDASGNSMLLGGTSWTPQNLNPAYVAAVDAMVESAANHGIYLFLDPFSVGYDPGPGDFDPVLHSTEEMRQWGEFWGRRYQGQPHVNFVLGNDRLVAPQVDSLVSGLQKYMPDRLMTTDWCGGPPDDWSQDATGPRRYFDLNHRWVNFNAWYQYHAPQWATWYHYNMVAPVMPTCIFESFYEQCDYGVPKPNPPTPPLMMREETWGAVLNGGSGFGILGSADCTDDPMPLLGKNPGLEAAGHCTAFFATRRWYDLVPDWSHELLTSQTGTPGKSDFTYASAARTGDGTLAVCYYPGRRGGDFPLTVAMSKLGGGKGNSRTRWYDPTKGSFEEIGTLPNSGNRTFTTPATNSMGASDWVLVLEAN